MVSSLESWIAPRVRSVDGAEERRHSSIRCIADWRVERIPHSELVRSWRVMGWPLLWKKPAFQVNPSKLGRSESPKTLDPDAIVCGRRRAGPVSVVGLSHAFSSQSQLTVAFDGARPFNGLLSGR